MSSIQMRSMTGGRTIIAVNRNPKTGIDIVFSRSSEGELLVRLTDEQASELSQMLSSAVAGDRDMEHG